MRALGQRLRRALGDGPATAARPEPAARSSGWMDLETHARIIERQQRWAARDADPPAFEEIAPGREETTQHGNAWVIDLPYPLHFSHGDRRVGAVLGRDFDHLAELTGDARLDGFDPRQALFLDIETSGLEHRAGAYAFLIGIGWFEGDDFLIRQLFLRDPSEESAVLELFARAIDRFRFLVSFNGKSYDLTVLGARLVVNRFFTQRDCDLKLRPHLDLLHLSRNLYKGLWTDTRLQTLEREALGFERVDDVPGSMVASCWYHYQRTANPLPLAGVLEHNRLDVLSMVTLADRLIVDSRLDRARGQARMLLNLGWLLSRRKLPEHAVKALGAAAERARDSEVRRRALKLLAQAARRAGQPELQGEALALWEAEFPDDREALVARAVFLERGARDLEEALTLARRARELRRDAAIERRIERLGSKFKSKSKSKTETKTRSRRGGLPCAG